MCRPTAGEGLFIAHSIRENIALPHLSAWSKFGVMSDRQELVVVRRNDRSPQKYALRLRNSPSNF